MMRSLTFHTPPRELSDSEQPIMIPDVAGKWEVTKNRRVISR